MKWTRSLTLLLFAVLAAGSHGCQTGKDYRWAASPDGSEPLANNGPADAVSRKNGLLMARATLCEVDNKPGEALQLYEAVTQSEPDRADAWHRLAILHTNLGDLQAAENCFQRALQADRASAQLHNDYGYYCHLQQRTDAALEHLLRAVALDPGLPTAHTNLGLVFARMGRYSEAQAQFQLAGCTRAESHSNVAFTRLMEADLDGARKSYESALEDDPQLASARGGLDALTRLAAEGAATDADADATPAAALRAQPVSYRTESEPPGEDPPKPPQPALRRNVRDGAGNNAAAGQYGAEEMLPVQRIRLAPPNRAADAASSDGAAGTVEAPPVRSTLRIVDR